MPTDLPSTAVDHINLDTLQDDNINQSLFDYFQEKEIQLQNYTIESGPCSFKDGRQFNLEHQVKCWWTQVDENAYEPRYSIQEVKIDGGSYGEVYKELATLKPIYSQSKLEISYKQRAVKNFSNHLNLTEAEYNVMTEEEYQNIPRELRPKLLLNSHAIIMRLAKGSELFGVIYGKDVNDNGKTVHVPGIKLNIPELITLCINLLHALQEQVVDKGIAHRDIKPENIIFDDQTGEVRIVDYGYAIKKEHYISCGLLYGTKGYIAPEIQKRQAPEESFYAWDVYSMGVVLFLCLILTIKYIDEEIYAKATNHFDKGYISIAFLNEVRNTLKDESLKNLVDVIIGMMASDWHKRFTLNNALKKCYEIKYNMSKNDLNETYIQAETLYHSLKDLENSKIEPSNISLLKSKIENGVKNVREDNLVIFLDRLRIRAFKKVKKQADFFQIMDSILEDFDRYQKEIIFLRDQVDCLLKNSPNNKILLEIKHKVFRLNNKYLRYDLKIDDLAHLNQRYSEKISVIKKEIDKFKQSREIQIQGEKKEDENQQIGIRKGNVNGKSFNTFFSKNLTANGAPLNDGLKSDFEKQRKSQNIP